MKLLRVTAEGLPLFTDKLDISFYALQRVSEDDKESLYPIFNNYYLNTAIAFIGVNASGKTSVLRVLSFITSMIGTAPINHISSKGILGESKRVELNVYFYSENESSVSRLQTVIQSEVRQDNRIVYKIASEALWSKDIKTVATKKDLTDFNGMEPVARRNEAEAFLPDDVSFIIAYNKNSNEEIELIDLLPYTDNNELPIISNVPYEIVTFLDSSIEYLNISILNKKTFIKLKFKGKSEITLHDIDELKDYLSSGTVKGIITYMMTTIALKTGGYLIIDELENHFNKEIASTLIRFFTNRNINRNGATLFFSTHYPEILDEFDRNDSIYITKNKEGLSVQNLSMILSRNDIKKSDAYESGIINGTTPQYDSYIKLKEMISKTL